jgi:hypothetical protein
MVRSSWLAASGGARKPRHTCGLRGSARAANACGRRESLHGRALMPAGWMTFARATTSPRTVYHRGEPTI